MHIHIESVLVLFLCPDLDWWNPRIAIEVVEGSRDPYWTS